MSFLKYVLSLLVLAGVAVAGYWFWSERGITLRFSAAEIEQRITAQLPYEKSHFGLLKFTFNQADVSMFEDFDRIAVSMEVEVEILKLLGTDGRVAVSGSPSYRPEDAGFYLTKIEIDQLEFKGLPDKYASQARAAITKSLQLFYEQRPVYTLKDSGTKQRVAKFVLQSIGINEQNLVVKFGAKANQGKD